MVSVVQSDSNEDSQGRQLCMNKRLTKVVSSAPRARFQKARPKVPSLKREPTSTSVQIKPVTITKISESNKETPTINGNGESNSGSSDAKECVPSAELSVIQILPGKETEEKQAKCDIVETKITESESGEVVFIEDKSVLSKEKVISSEETEKVKKSSTSHVDQNRHLVSNSDKGSESCSSSNTNWEDSNELISLSPAEDTTAFQICEREKYNSVKNFPLNTDEGVTADSLSTVKYVNKSPSNNKKRAELATNESITLESDSEAIKSPLNKEIRTENSASLLNTSLESVAETFKCPSSSEKVNENSANVQNASTVSGSKVQGTVDINAKNTAQPKTSETLHRSVPNTPTEERNDISSSTTEKSSKYPHLTSILSKKRIEPKRDVQHKKRKRYKKGDTAPERSKMTMEDLIYWNPTSEDAGLKKVSNVDDPPVIINDVEPEECLDEDVINEEENPSGPVPRLIISEDGEINIDQGSLVIQRKTLPIQNVIERNEDTTYASFRKRPLSKHWTTKETTIFYKALSLVGTDFGLMEKLLPNRTRRELKLKFKREEKYNIDLVNKAMYDSMLTFDENTLEEHIEMLNAELFDEAQEVDQSSLKENKRSKAAGKRRKKKDADETEGNDKEINDKNESGNENATCNKTGRKKKQPPSDLTTAGKDAVVDENLMCKKRGRKRKQLPSDLITSGVDAVVDENSLCKKRGRKKKQLPSDLITSEEDSTEADDAIQFILEANREKENDEDVVISNRKELSIGRVASTRKRKKKKLPDDFISIYDVEDITELTGADLINDEYSLDSPKRNLKSGMNHHKPPHKSPASKVKSIPDKMSNNLADKVEIVYVEELSSIDSDFNQETNQAVIIAKGPALTVPEVVNNSILDSENSTQTLPYSSDNQETECITVNIISNYGGGSPLNVVVGNEIVTSETGSVKQKRSAGSTLKKIKKETSQGEPSFQPSFANYTPKEESLLSREKNIHFSPEPNLKTYSRIQTTPQSANALISSLQTPSLTPVQSSSLLTSLNVSNHQPVAIPLTPPTNSSQSPVMLMAKSPNTDNIIHLFMYKSPPS